MKLFRKGLAMLMACTILLSISSNSSAAGADENAIHTTVEQYFTLYMDGRRDDVHPDISAVTVSNTNTLLYNEIMNYEVDVSALLGRLVDSYSFTITSHELNIAGDTATLSLLVKFSVNYNGLADTSLHNAPYTFSLKKTLDGWKISNIDTDDLIFNQFVADIPTTRANDSDAILAQAKALSEERISGIMPLVNGDTALLRYGDTNSAETQRKLADREAAESTPVPAASVYVDYDRYVAIAYANEYASPHNGEFYEAVVDGINQDCTNFVSQCVWAGYGGWNSSGSSATNIARHYRMYYTGGSNWYGNDWFGHKTGGSGPWETVDTHYNFVTSYPAIGPRGTGYNNNKVYTNLAASAIDAGETIQLKKPSSSKYQHSIFCVSIDTDFPNPITYNQVICNAHNDDYYKEPLTTWIAAFGGSSCYLRTISYGRAIFSS